MIRIHYYWTARAFAGLVGFLGLSAAPLHAQQAPQSNQLPAEEEILVLSAFEVRSSNDSGYRVENSVSTTGIAQALMDTPLPITVVTSEFMRDAGLEGFRALSYVSSINYDPHAGNGNFSPGLNRGNSQPNGTTFRGQPYNGTYRNGLRLFYGFATENVDRIEVAKGPMAVFVGGATLGGEVNVITKRPLFDRQEEFSLRIGSHDYFRAAWDSTGPITKTLAYRLMVNYKDGSTWRDHSRSESLFVNPQLLWQPSAKFTTRLDGYVRKSTGNLVSQNVSSTTNYQHAYDNPTQALLDLGKRRGPDALPFTEAEYRTRIGQAFGTWRQDVFDTTGQWVSLGTPAEDLITGNGPSGRAYNWYGPNAGFKEPVRVLENDSTLVVTDWLQLRAIGRYMHADLEHGYYSFGQRQYADGNFPLDFGSATRSEQTALDGKIEAALKGQWWKLDGNLLVGLQYNGTRFLGEDATLNYSNVLSVPASPFVGNNPAATLTGQQVYHWFDPRVHPFPDTRLITRWPSEVRSAGQFAYSYSKSINRAHFAAASLGAFDHRITLTGGVRRGSASAYGSQKDPSRMEIAGSSSYRATPTTTSYMYGATARIVKGINLYASYNKGDTARTGSLVSRVSFGISPPDIVTPAEQAENPVPNELGEGKEIGLKFDLIDHKLTGSVGWFRLNRGNMLVADSAKSGADPRNIGTEADSNPATSNPGVRQRVAWAKPIDGNISAGFEADLVWTPNPNYSLILGASHLTENAITVSRPLGSDPATNRDFLVLTGRPLDLAPDDTVRVYQRYVFTEGGLKGGSVGVGVRYQSDFWPSSSNSAWGIVFPDFTVCDLTLGYDTKVWAKKVVFTFNINNVLNSTYIEGQRVFGAPREYFLSARLTF